MEIQFLSVQKIRKNLELWYAVTHVAREILLDLLGVHC